MKLHLPDYIKGHIPFGLHQHVALGSIRGKRWFARWRNQSSESRPSHVTSSGNSPPCNMSTAGNLPVSSIVVHEFAQPAPSDLIWDTSMSWRDQWKRSRAAAAPSDGSWREKRWSLRWLASVMLCLNYCLFLCTRVMDDFIAIQIETIFRQTALLHCWNWESEIRRVLLSGIYLASFEKVW